jgi:hypothetical protein
MIQEQVLQEFEILEAGSSYISKNAKNFGEKYPKRFIAVRDNQLLAVGNTFEDVTSKLAEKKIDSSLVLIVYIPGQEEIILY